MATRGNPPWPGDRARSRGQKVCRLCARGNLPTNRHSWHPKCSRLATAIYNVWGSLSWCLRRQEGKCNVCQTQLAVKDGKYDYNHYWQVKHRTEIDHIVPFWKVDMMPREKQTIRYWLPGNLQALCRSCHAAKTKREAGERSRARSAQAELAL